MNITQITVSYGETQSLPEYSNVKPNITITATLDEGESPGEVEQLLWNQAKAAVHAQIDLALEANDRAAKYDPAPRYQVMKTYHDRWADRDNPEPPKIVVILPNELNLPRDAYGVGLVHTGYPESRKLRYAHALRVAESAVRECKGSTLLDCSHGDLTILDLTLPKYTPPKEKSPAQHPIDALADNVNAEWEGDDEEDEA